MSPDSKKENKIKFILAAKELMKDNDIKDISVRKIADVAGFHNSTIYLYFKDLDELLSLASVTYFYQYAVEITNIKENELSTLEYYLKVWECFCRNTFVNADIFYKFFFGEHSKNISSILNEYYILFPEEKQNMSDVLHEMYYGDNISERCLSLMKPLIDSDYTRITKDNIELINSIIVYNLKGTLSDLSTQDPSSVSYYIDRFMESIKCIIY